MASIGDTAKMLAQLDFKDNLSKGVGTAIKSVDRLEAKFGKVGSIAAQGFKNIGTNVKNLLTGPVGLLGLGAGVLGVTRFLTESVSKARDFGEAVFRVKAIIGGTTTATGQLVDVLGDYGIESDAIVRIGGMFEKNLGNITKTAKSAAKFQSDYGLALVDSTGKAKDFNTILLEAADLFTNKTIPQSTKAAALAKLYGRNWQELVPILSMGRSELEKTLGKGITLTDAQAKSMEKARKAGIKWDDAIGDLQTTIGIELLPAITKFITRATNFVNEHGDEIRAFFRDAAKFATDMGRAIKQDVLPAISKIGDIWAGIPDDLKKLLIGGFVVNKLSGGAITGIVSELGKGLIKGVLGMNAGVVNINAGVVNGAGGVPGGGKTPTGGTGIVGTALKTTIIGFAGVALADLAIAVSGLTDPKHKDPVTGAIFRGTNVVSERIENTRNAIKGLEQRAADGDAVAQRQLAGQQALLAELLAEGRGISSSIDTQTGKMKDDQILSATRATKQASQLTRASVLGTTTAVRTGSVANISHLNTIASAVRSDQARTANAIASGSSRINRNLDQVEAAVRSKKNRITIIPRLTTIFRSPEAKPTLLSFKSTTQRIAYASGGVGLATRPTPAIFGEAGNEAFAILRNPRRGLLGGGAPPQVHVTVNIDPRRITRKQTSSGVYKTYVAS